MITSLLVVCVEINRRLYFWSDPIKSPCLLLENKHNERCDLYKEIMFGSRKLALSNSIMTITYFVVVFVKKDRKHYFRSNHIIRWYAGSCSSLENMHNERYYVKKWCFVSENLCYFCFWICSISLEMNWTLYFWSDTMTRAYRLLLSVEKMHSQWWHCISWRQGRYLLASPVTKGQY